MFGLGVWLYVCAPSARDSIRQHAFPACVALLFVTHVSDAFSKPPASLGEVAWRA